MKASGGSSDEQDSLRDGTYRLVQVLAGLQRMHRSQTSRGKLSMWPWHRKDAPFLFSLPKARHTPNKGFVPFSELEEEEGQTANV